MARVDGGAAARVSVLPCMQGSEAVMALLDVAPGVSRVHASRRVFDLLQRHEVDIPVIHQRTFAPGTHFCLAGNTRALVPNTVLQAFC